MCIYIYIYIKLIKVSLVNIPSSHIDTKSKKKKTFFFLVMRTVRIYFLSNFHIYHTEALTIVIMLYIALLVFILQLEVIFDYINPLSLSLHTLPLVTTNQISFSMLVYFSLLPLRRKERLAFPFSEFLLTASSKDFSFTFQNTGFFQLFNLFLFSLSFFSPFFSISFPPIIHHF